MLEADRRDGERRGHHKQAGLRIDQWPQPVQDRAAARCGLRLLRKIVDARHFRSSPQEVDLDVGDEGGESGGFRYESRMFGPKFPRTSEAGVVVKPLGYGRPEVQWRGCS
jgi:hypothetical protein